MAHFDNSTQELIFTMPHDRCALCMGFFLEDMLLEPKANDAMYELNAYIVSLISLLFPLTQLHQSHIIAVDGIMPPENKERDCNIYSGQVPRTYGQPGQ